ncbi:hypothetical protein Mucpa_0860 [Mucilaginibacter paludis DSM 18603]|uniref:Uncharacterized protein n=1 Tax=Mucilaginibacter paludis DSM 18603 TaxID=714943 RepID=H1YBH0_9SPHI|nr:hypothetical protein Mucpa_0860 [Mucilaginibacter paludis DSM 18603]
MHNTSERIILRKQRSKIDILGRRGASTSIKPCCGVRKYIENRIVIDHHHQEFMLKLNVDFK